MQNDSELISKDPVGLPLLISHNSYPDVWGSCLSVPTKQHPVIGSSQALILLGANALPGLVA